MRWQRPKHLAERQVRGRAFSEPVAIIRTTGSRALGEYTETEAEPTDTLCATAPARAADARVRLLVVGGIRLEAIRQFWTAETLEPVVEGEAAGDILVFGRQRWRVRATQRWHRISDSLAVRQEGQTVGQ